MARGKVELPAEAELAQRYAGMKEVCCRFVAAYQKGGGTIAKEELGQLYKKATDIVGENVESWWWLKATQERGEEDPPSAHDAEQDRLENAAILANAAGPPPDMEDDRGVVRV